MPCPLTVPAILFELQAAWTVAAGKTTVSLFVIVIVVVVTGVVVVRLVLVLVVVTYQYSTWRPDVSFQVTYCS